MRFSSFSMFGPVFLLAAEILTYGLVIQRFGVAVAILIGISSLALGLFVFRRLGLTLGSLGKEDLSDEGSIWRSVKRIGFAAFGAFLLVLPGFLSNLVGFLLVLATPKVWFFAPGRVETRDSPIIDLDPSDWIDSENQQNGNHSSQRNRSDLDKF